MLKKYHPDVFAVYAASAKKSPVSSRGFFCDPVFIFDLPFLHFLFIRSALLISENISSPYKTGEAVRRKIAAHQHFFLYADSAGPLR